MALGIVLHASLSFFPSAWPVQDTEQSGYFYLFDAVIHSFRMPLFFVLSGFFTAFLLRRSGLEETVRQRALRILLPMLLALVTIIPLNNYISEIGTERTRLPKGEADPMVSAIICNDAETVRREFGRLGPGWTDGQRGSSALYWAALSGHPEMVELCLSQGCEIGRRDPSGLAPLHAAALFGRDRAVASLLECGADPAGGDSHGLTPFQRSIVWAAFAPDIARWVGIPAVDEATLADGRARSSEILLAAAPRPSDAVPLLYNQFLLSNIFRFAVGGTDFQVFGSKIFGHLWFLWLLWWLFVTFAVAWKFGFAPSGRHLWIFPLLSFIPQWLMTSSSGPDLWLGPLPPPHVVFYYGCFFWFGAAVFARDGMQAKMGERWKILLPLGLFVLLPACLALLGNKIVATVFQTSAAWVLLLGVIGVFHRFDSSLGPKARWLSDASYWMYLAHVPLVMAVQLAVAFLPWPVAVKFLLVNVVVIAVLLMSYQLFVRYSWLGTLLNGPRKKPEGPATA